ncbi:MAG: nucleotide sugar dehydrogenase [Candidatus Staskawiczbacteria bacterium]|nr:nucleotide sugar dehydrogenase [Candidatus Staskawiczbacteria bacterium]
MEIKNICVIGMGFIGTTLAAVLAEAGFVVFGVEKDKEKLELLKQAKPHFHENGLPEVLADQLNKNLFIFDKIPEGRKIDAFVISVATPVDEETKKPDLSHVKSAVQDLLPYLEEGQLVMLRSTVPVGTTRKIVLQILQEKCQNVRLSFCPERTVEGRALEELKTLPQIIGALNEESGNLSSKIFSQITPAIVRTSSLEAAEIIKLINNSYRDFNFAFANQTALICKSLGLDANEVVEAANFGYNRSNVLHAGFVASGKAGFVGGVCLEKDPYILSNSSNADTSLIKAARELNQGLVKHVFERAVAHLKEKNIYLENANIFISGFAFKGRPETDDMRGSPAIQLLDFFKKSGVKEMHGHDFVVKPKNIEKLGVKVCSLEDAFKVADVLVFMNNHKGYNDISIGSLAKNMKEDALLFDGWQIFSDKLRDSNINYESIGFKKNRVA